MARVERQGAVVIPNTESEMPGNAAGILVRSLARTFGAGVLMILVHGLYGSSVRACSCGPESSGPACQLISRVSFVFLGECVELLPDPRVGAGPGASLYRFRVDRVYKGLDPRTNEILVNPDNFTSCGTEYPTGKEYLIFASPGGGDPLMVMAGGCSGSRRADLNRADVEFLDAYLKGSTDTAVYGKVLQWVPSMYRLREEESATVEGASVVLTSETDRFTTVSQADGSFRFGAVPPGAYRLAAQLDPYVPEPSSREVVVGKGECKEIFLQLKPLSSIEGVLLGADGHPAAKQEVQVLRRSQNGKWHRTSKMYTRTDDQGNFSFEDIGSGDFLLGFEIWSDAPSDYSPYPTWYFPGVATRAEAEVISLAPRQTKRDLKFSLAPAHHERKITIRVAWPEGTPPGKNLLQIFHDGNLIKNLEGDNNGTFVFTGYQEREYEFSARYWVDNLHGAGPVFNKRIARPDPVKLLPGKDAAEVVLVLSREFKRDDDEG